MTGYIRESLYAVRFTGLGGSRPPAWWHAMLGRIGAMWQKRIAAQYARERGPTPTGWKKFKPNSRKWNAIKAKKGYSRLRGHMLNRIQAALMRAQLYSVSQVVFGSPNALGERGGSAVVTLSEEALRQIAPHARPYAQMKTELRRILAINLPMIAEALRMLARFQAQAEADAARKRRAEAKAARAQSIKDNNAWDAFERQLILSGRMAGRDKLLAREALASSRAAIEAGLTPEQKREVRRRMRLADARTKLVQYMQDRTPWTLAQTATTVTRLTTAALRRI